MLKRGSEWRKWDLHVHTPATLANNQYGGDTDDAWEKFIADLEGLPPEFSVLGINDYIYIDGYERVLKEKQGGRLANIDTLFPVIEFRLDNFAGTESKLRKVNFHVIFSPELTPAIIKNEFLNALYAKYVLAVDFVWSSGFGTKDQLAAFGQAIKQTVPKEKLPEYGSDLVEGFNHLQFKIDDVIPILERTAFKKKYITAIGKTEWDDIKWTDRSVATKKDLINSRELVFIASKDPASFNKAKLSLQTAGVNSRLVDCSDAHDYMMASHKDRIGNCISWIKADTTFLGLMQVVIDYENRYYAGDIPQQLNDLRIHGSHYIKTISIHPDDPNLQDPWFNNDIPLNPGFVAIVGNKGTGKSALADIISLLGSSSVDPDKYSFLHPTKFRKNNIADDYNGTIEWQDGSIITKTLGEKVDRDTESERVKYLTQSHVEAICNEAGVSNEFQKEIDKVVFDYLPTGERHNCDSLQSLLNLLQSGSRDKLGQLRERLRKQIESIVRFERFSAPEYKNRIDNLLKEKQEELSRIAAPNPVEEPSEKIDEAVQKTIDQLSEKIGTLSGEIETKEIRQAFLNDRKTVLQNIYEKLDNLQFAFDSAKIDIEDDLQTFGLAFDDVAQLKINRAKLDELRKPIEDELASLDILLMESEKARILENKSSLHLQRLEARNEISAIRDSLDVRNRAYQEYLRAVKNYELRKNKLMGIEGTLSQETINGLKGIQAYLKETLKNDIEGAYDGAMKISGEIFDTIQQSKSILEKVYKPLSSFVSSLTSITDSQGLRQLDFSIGILCNFEELEEGFHRSIDHSRAGYFRGISDGSTRFREIFSGVDFSNKDATRDFVKRILDLLSKEGEEEIRIEKQLIKSFDGLAYFLQFLLGLEYLSAKYTLLFKGKELNRNELSPGEKGAILLIFYLLIDRDRCPLIIDQPEENLDNESVVDILVPFVQEAKRRRQIILVTHNPNLTVVCDADQVVRATMDKRNNMIRYDSGSLEDLGMGKIVVNVLEGTRPAFDKRISKHEITRI